MAAPLPRRFGAAQPGRLHIRYSLTGSTALTGADPLLAAQWHLNNTAASTAGEDLRATLALN